MKTKEELNMLKEKTGNLNKKLSELSDEELQKVVGGKVSPGKVIALEEVWEGMGEWFRINNVVEDYAYTSCYAPRYGHSFIANKYWYNGSEAWYCGTCSIGEFTELVVINDPTTVHPEFTYEKPF